MARLNHKTFGNGITATLENGINGNGDPYFLTALMIDGNRWSRDWDEYTDAANHYIELCSGLEKFNPVQIRHQYVSEVLSPDDASGLLSDRSADVTARLAAVAMSKYDLRSTTVRYTDADDRELFVIGPDGF